MENGLACLLVMQHLSVFNVHILMDTICKYHVRTIRDGLPRGVKDCHAWQYVDHATRAPVPLELGYLSRQET